MLSSLVLAKLATIVTEPLMARPGVTLMVELIHITDAGRMWLEGQAAIAKALGIGRGSTYGVLEADSI
jgi:hypothetical protein